MAELLEQEWIVVGRIGASYGIKGWNHVNSFTTPPENILQYGVWYLEQKGNWVAYKVEAGRKHGAGLVALLEGIKDPETASLLTQCKIAVQRSQLPELPSDEYYWADLEGLAVQTTTGTVLGQVDYLYDNAGTDVMVVKTTEGEKQIPFLLDDTIIRVDLENKIIVVDWEIPR